MFSRYRDLLQDKNTPINIRVLNMLLIFIEIFSIIAFVLFHCIHMDMYLQVSVAFITISIPILWALGIGLKKYNLTNILFSYLLNVLMLPLLFVYGGGLYSGSCILFIGGFIVTFILLDGPQLYIAALIDTVWYSFVIAYAYYHPEIIHSLMDGNSLLIDVVISFTVSCMVAFFSLVMYEIVYRRMSESFEESMNRIRETGAVKSRFLANMSHELRTPMNAILGMAELLERDENNHDVHFEISMIKDSALALLTTINNVLIYSKLDSQKLSLLPNQFSFSKLMQDIIYTINMELSDKNIQFFVEIDPRIPDVIYGDSNRIRQVFQYILFNSAKDTDDGRILVEISHVRNPKKNNITINARISDTGIGLTEEEKNSIFNSFEIYDSKKHSQLKRIGLELTICRYILKMMNGDIRVDSINGIGTSIELSFEVFQVENTPIVPVPSNYSAKVLIFIYHNTRVQRWNTLMNQFGVVPDYASSYAAFDMRLREKKYDFIIVSDYTYDTVENLIREYHVEDKTFVITDYTHVFGNFGNCPILRRPINCMNLAEMLLGTWDSANYLELENRDTIKAPDAKVLVVDDNMVNLKVVSSIFQRYGINPSIATSGREAIDRCGQDHFDLIFIDQMMPEMSGHETLKEIRSSVEEHYRKIPIICLTATIGTDVRQEVLREGFQEYLAKPIKARYLEEILKNFLPSELIISAVPDLSTQKVPSNNSKAEAFAEAFPPGLSAEKGIVQVGGDESVYEIILNTYYREGLEKLTAIPKQYAEGDLPLYIINVHAVKGSSASIGALEVSELFRQLEMAGKGNDLPFIETHMDNALSKYSLLLEEVRQYLIDHGNFEAQEEQFEDVEEVEFEISTMQDLAGYLDNMDFMECETILEGWKQNNYGAEINNYISSIQKAFDDFDYDRAAEIAQDFIEVFS